MGPSAAGEVASHLGYWLSPSVVVFGPCWLVIVVVLVLQRLGTLVNDCDWACGGGGGRDSQRG